MPILPLRKLPDRPNASVMQEWLATIEADLDDASIDNNDVCRRVLCEITYPEYATNWETAVNDASIPHGTRLALAALDPRNITLEPEYYAVCDDE
jgi:hypothetical protein